MNKTELCGKVSKLTNIPAYEVGVVINATFACIEKALVDQDTVFIPGFGKFELRTRNMDMSKNPLRKEGGPLMIKYRTVAFRPSAHLKEAVKL